MMECNALVTLRTRYQGIYTKIKRITARWADQTFAHYNINKAARIATITEYEDVVQKIDTRIEWWNASLEKT